MKVLVSAALAALVSMAAIGPASADTRMVQAGNIHPVVYHHHHHRHHRHHHRHIVHHP